MLAWLKRKLGGTQQAAPSTKVLKVSELFGGVPLHRFGDYTTYLGVGSGKVWATWRSLDIIANAVKTTPFALLRDKTTTPVAVPGLDQILKYPNEQETWRDFLYRTIFHYRLTGQAFWLKSEANLKGERPRELYNLNPRRMEIVPDANNGIAGYLFNVNGKKIPFDVEEIMMFRRPHPNRDLHGLGDIEAGDALLSEFINRTTAAENFYANGATLSGVLIAKNPPASEEEWKRGKAEWNRQYGGVKNAGKVAFLTGDWSYQQLGVTSQEMQDIERTKYGVEQIFLLHGVPLSVAGVRDAANYATADIDTQRFKEYTVLPDVKTLEDTINSDLVKGFAPNVSLVFNISGLLNIGKIITDHTPLFDRGGLTVNEFRAAVGLPQDPENELWNQTWIQASLVPLDLASLGAAPIEQQAQAIQAAAALRSAAQ